jgi:Flp pilus assembly CpaE family ATPase
MMPKPTLTELVHRLEHSVTVLEEQIKGIDTCDEAIQRHSNEIMRLTVDLVVVREKAAALETLVRDKLATLEKSLDQISQRRWTLYVAILSAFLGGFLTLFIQWSLRALPK